MLLLQNSGRQWSKIHSTYKASKLITRTPYLSSDMHLIEASHLYACISSHDTNGLPVVKWLNSCWPDL